MVNNVPVYDTTKIVDLALASLFGYQDDSLNATLFSGNPLANQKGLVNQKGW
ncbi:MAG: hypothetical protein IPJ79_08935 [Bacteroidetes bacterium]|nr:hypothetical protein [Bacteroidota bacterium]